MRTRRQLDDAAAALVTADPVMGRLVDAYGPVRLGTPVRAAGRFQELARAVSYQQLAGAAAAAIWGRVHDLAEPPTPKVLLGLGEIYRPHRSLAAWYCWQVADNRPPVGA